MDQGFTTKATRRYDVGCSDTIIEHEQAMDALMRRLKGAGSGLTDPFTIVEKCTERYPIYNDATHWKLKKAKVIKFMLI